MITYRKLSKMISTNDVTVARTTELQTLASCTSRVMSRVAELAEADTTPGKERH